MYIFLTRWRTQKNIISLYVEINSINIFGSLTCPRWDGTYANHPVYFYIQNVFNKRCDTFIYKRIRHNYFYNQPGIEHSPSIPQYVQDLSILTAFFFGRDRFHSIHRHRFENL